MKAVVSVVILSMAIVTLSIGCRSGSPKTTAPEKSATASAPAAAVQIAPQQVTQPAINDQNAPKLSFESTKHDFGVILPDSKTNAEFKFTNTGKSTLKIGPVVPTCGCTIAQLSKTDYAPGESGTINIEYHASKAAGPTTKQIRVNSNDPHNSLIELILASNVVIPVEIKPEAMSLALDQPNAGAVPVIIKSKDGKPFAVKSIESTSSIFSAQIDPNKTDTSFVIPLTIDTEKLKSALTGYVRFSITHPGIDIVTLTFTAPAEFETQPSSIIIRNAAPLAVVEREVWVKSNYNKNFEIESITSKAGHIKVVKQEKVDNLFKLFIAITAPDQQKMMFFTDTLIIKIKGGNEITVPVRGFFKTATK